MEAKIIRHKTINDDIKNNPAKFKRMKSIMSKLDVKYILGGHGKRYDKDSYVQSLNYLKILRKTVKKAHVNDVDVEDIKIPDSLLKKREYTLL